MYYLRGLVNSNRDTVFLPQRVVAATPAAATWRRRCRRTTTSSIVAERYPNSRYAADARQRMVSLRNMFARHELDTALYYLRRGA